MFGFKQVFARVWVEILFDKMFDVVVLFWSIIVVILISLLKFDVVVEGYESLDGDVCLTF